MKIGAHLSVAGGFFKAVETASLIGANCLQIFSSSPRDWGTPRVGDEQIEKFVRLKKEKDIAPVFFHATYLINLADEGETGRRSRELLIAELNLCPQMGILGSVVHLGSFKDGDGTLDRYTTANGQYLGLVKSIKEVLANTPSEAWLIAENAGNRKIGKTIEELAAIIRDVSNERLKICLDTCHLHAAGVSLSTHESLKTFLDEFDQKIGLSKLALIHLNDSKDALGSLRDRHENIGQGKVGMEVFRGIINEPRLAMVPLILEVPGILGDGPDRENIEVVKKLTAVS